MTSFIIASTASSEGSAASLIWAASAGSRAMRCSSGWTMPAEFSMPTRLSACITSASRAESDTALPTTGEAGVSCTEVMGASSRDSD